MKVVEKVGKKKKKAKVVVEEEFTSPKKRVCV